MDRVQPTSTKVYIEPDQPTPRNLTIQKVALLGIALGIGTGLLTAHWIVAIGVLTLSAALFVFQRNIDIRITEPPEQVTLLEKSIRKGNLWAVKVLLAFGANPNRPSLVPLSCPPLVGATSLNLDILTALIEAGANPDSTDALDRTALHWAAFHLNKDTISYLLSVGANPKLECRNTNGTYEDAFGPKGTPLDSAQIQLQERINSAPECQWENSKQTVEFLKAATHLKTTE